MVIKKIVWVVVLRVRGHLALWWGAPPPADPLGQARATPITPSFLIDGGSGEEAREKGVRKQQMALNSKPRRRYVRDEVMIKK